MFSHSLHDRYNDRVTELLVGLGIADRDPEIIRKTHQTSTFTRRQTAWAGSRPPGNQNFAANRFCYPLRFVL